MVLNFWKTLVIYNDFISFCSVSAKIVWIRISIKTYSIFYVLRPIMRGPAATPCTPARRGRTRQAARDLNTANMADSYFHAQSEKVMWLLLQFCIAQIFKSVAC
jgi:hypothetical protein